MADSSVFDDSELAMLEAAMLEEEMRREGFTDEDIANIDEYEVSQVPPTRTS